MKFFPVFLLAWFFWGPLAAKELVVGVENINYYPISAMRQGQYAGFARDVLDAFARQYGHTISYKAYPVKSLFGAYLAGQVDFKFPDNVGWAQENKDNKAIVYSRPVLESIDGVMVYPHAQGRGLGALKRLGTIVGFTRFAYLEEIAAGKVKRHEHESLEGLMKLVQSNFVDGVYSNVFVTRYFLKHSHYGKDFIVFDKNLPYEVTGYALSSYKYPEVIRQFDEFLTQHGELLTALKMKYELN